MKPVSLLTNLLKSAHYCSLVLQYAPIDHVVAQPVHSTQHAWSFLSRRSQQRSYETLAPVEHKRQYIRLLTHIPCVAITVFCSSASV